MISTYSKTASALCASLVMHGLLLLVLTLSVIAELDRELYSLPWIGRMLLNDDSQKKEDVVGNDAGGGQAINASSGLQTAVGLQGDQEQAWLSRDPVGFGRPREPSLATQPPGGMLDFPRQPRPLLAAETEQAPALFGKAQTDGLLTVPHRRAIRPAPQQSPVPPVLADASPQPSTPGDGGHALAPIAATGADPAPMSEQESDPFTKGRFAVVSSSGQIDARFGRKMKFIKPRLTHKGLIDLATSSSPYVSLFIRIDATGKVVEVSWPPVKSSGSNEIDMPVFVAAWKWWFEPPKDAQGNPQPDSFTYGVVWRN